MVLGLLHFLAYKAFVHAQHSTGTNVWGAVSPGPLIPQHPEVVGSTHGPCVLPDVPHGHTLMHTYVCPPTSTNSSTHAIVSYGFYFHLTIYALDGFYMISYRGLLRVALQMLTIHLARPLPKGTQGFEISFFQSTLTSVGHTRGVV